MRKVFKKMKKRLSGEGNKKVEEQLARRDSDSNDASVSSDRQKDLPEKPQSPRRPSTVQEEEAARPAAPSGSTVSGSKSTAAPAPAPDSETGGQNDADEEPDKEKPRKDCNQENGNDDKDIGGRNDDSDNNNKKGKDGYEESSPDVIKTYSDVPMLETNKLPRGGISVETKAVGRVQFGIPPETIKDSMRLGLPVPQVYIVPVERFCREMGPALGVNLAEFEFPAYFNFFVYKKRCTLVVDSADAEQNIRRVFSETLLGPAQFRREVDPIPAEMEDFSEDFPRDAIPNFAKELKHFRIMPDGKELVLETLLNFRHFHMPMENVGHENLGVVRPPEEESEHDDDEDSSSEDEEGDNDEPKEVPKDLKGVEKREKTPWTYNQARWMGDVATVWPPSATEEQIAARSVPRVEIFKMPGGTEYILHDIDEDNYIIGKARFSGHVKVSEQMSVEGFGGHSILDDVNEEDQEEDEEEKAEHPSQEITKKQELPRTFHPPSFGVTVLGNSHGFDKSGSVSGYVLWINGRGVMIDPPPYSSATLEREGIRPRMIVGIIITHCHADHDAGAFQKVLTGSPVVVITTPTIYKSFIRKYAALSALSPALLRHSHRYKPAIIGQPLRFQGATFHFTYTLHTIPCVGFRVEWRGRSMVFTGDHFNSPPAIDMLEETGVLTHSRAEDLRQLPLQETDLLLHEAGAPPIHTPLEVLIKLPTRVKKRLYVVHTSALPEDCELKVAPTGTAGTIRLDKLQKSRSKLADRGMSHRNWSPAEASPATLEEEDALPSAWNGANSEYGESLSSAGSLLDDHSHENLIERSSGASKKSRSSSMFISNASGSEQMTHDIPLVSLRPASSTDAWFILNLLSAVPFLSSLSYASTMEVLETCRVDAYCVNDVVVPSSRRSQVLCVVWEGTCAERPKQSTSVSKPNVRGSLLPPIGEQDVQDGLVGAVWYAGDWTGPLAVQPERRLSGESQLSDTHDVVAISNEGVKVITIENSHLHPILKSGSPLYRKYLDRRAQQERAQNLEMTEGDHVSATEQLLGEALRNLNILELLNCNSALRKLSAVQKRHLESLAEGPVSFLPGERIWRSGAPVDKAFIIVSGTASFVPRRRNAGSANVPSTMSTSSSGKFRSDQSSSNGGIGEEMRQDALKAIEELGNNTSDRHDEESSASSVDSRKYEHVLQFDSIFTQEGRRDSVSSHGGGDDFGKLSSDLQRHAENNMNISSQHSVGGSSMDTSEHNEGDSLEAEDYGYNDDGSHGRGRRVQQTRRRSSKARFANKVLGRLYSRRAFTHGLIFSRGHFLGDVSKMVAGVLSSDVSSELNDDSSPSYGFGEMSESGEHGRRGSQTKEISLNVAEMVIHEQGNHNIMHSSTLTAGKDGCVVLVFPKSSFGPFLDEYPGLLLSLLGTQVVV